MSFQNNMKQSNHPLITVHYFFPVVIANESAGDYFPDYEGNVYFTALVYTSL